MIETPCGTPPLGQDFVPQGHVSRPGSTPHSYSLWGDSGDSNTDSITSHRRKFGQSLCRIVTGCSVAIVILAVLGIVGIAVYLGYFSSEDEGPNYTDKYVGSLRILEGDSWVQDLAYPDTPAFRAKASKYRNMIRSVFENSILGPAFENLEVHQFAALSSGKIGFDMTFQLNLDRRKVPFWHMKDTNIVIQKIFEQELQSPSPVAFQNFKIDVPRLTVNKLESTSETFEYISDPLQPPKDEELEELDLVPLKGKGGIIRVKFSDTQLKKEREHLMPPKEETTTTYFKTTSNLVQESSFRKPAVYFYESSTKPQPFISDEQQWQENENEMRVLIDETKITPEKHKKFTRPATTVTKLASPSSTKIRKPGTTDTKPAITVTESTTTVTKLPPTVTKPSTLATKPKVEATKATTMVTKPATAATETTPVTKLKTTKPPTTKQTTIPAPIYESSSIPTSTSSSLQSSTSSLRFTTWNQYITSSSKTSPDVVTTPDIKSSQLYNRVGLPPKIPLRNSDDVNEIITDDAPNMRDIQRILENLLFLATVKPTLLANNASHNDEWIPINKPSVAVNDFQFEDHQEHQQELKTSTKPYHSQTKPQTYPEQPKPQLYPQQPKPQSYPQQPRPQIYPEQPKPQSYPKQPRPQIYPEQPRPQTYPEQPQPQSYPEQPKPQVYHEQLRPQTYPEQPKPQTYTEQPKLQTYPEFYAAPQSGIQYPPYYVANRPLPLDRFRYQNKTPSTERTPLTSEKIHLSNSDYSKPMNIWDMLTTKKPMILDTEVVTSTSFDVKYGGSTKPLRPVYIHTSTIKDIYASLKPKTPQPSKVVIPVVTGSDVKYIQVNRTQPNYPNVVIVNLAELGNQNTSQLGLYPNGEKGREIKFSPRFFESVSNLLSLIKNQNEKAAQSSKINSNISKEPTLTSPYHHVSLNEESIIKENATVTNPINNISVWNALSHLSKLYMADQGSSNIGQNTPHSSEIIALNEDLLNPLNYFLHNQNYLPKPSNSYTTKRPNRKSGKSLKFRSTLTLFVIGKEDGRGAKVISVSGRSDPSPSKVSTMKNSPIHVFTVKEGQSLDDLLSEIIQSISSEEDSTSPGRPISENEKERDGHSHPSIKDSYFVPQNTRGSTLPAGEDSLKIIESLSKLLTDHYDHYNIIFGNDHYEQSSTVPTPIPTTPEESTTPLFGITISNNMNEIFPTTEDVSLTSENPQDVVTNKYHKYHHELFPVMTRPMNPIRYTSPRPFTPTSDSNDEQGGETSTTSSKPNEIATSFDVSYSMLTGDKNIIFPVRTNVSSSGCLKDEFQCTSGKCIPQLARCNMVRDCPDNSDEKLCSCSDILKNQHYNRKICDGIIDCWDQSDETNCDWCSPGHFICTGYRKCVHPESVCDGLPDCPDGDDERDCVTIAPNLVQANAIDYFDEGYLMVRRKGTWGKLCVENFEEAVSKAKVAWSVSELGDAVCKTLTFDSSSRIERAHDTSPPIFRSANTPYYEIDIRVGGSNEKQDITSEEIHRTHFNSKRSISRDLRRNSSSEELLKGSFSAMSEAFLNGLKSPSEYPQRLWKRAADHLDLKLQFQETKCVSKDIVKVKCEDLQCGIRPRATTQQARIVGGSSSSPGAWPWHAALYKEGEYQCGATLINSQWLISAGHCFYSERDAYWVARMGALRRGTKFPSPFEQVRTLSHIFVHPGYVSHGYINDISMLRLKEPVKLNDYIRPVCLPPPEAHITDGQRCTLVGWGQLFEVKKIFPDTLQEVEVPLISTKECQKRTLFLPLYRITDDMFCAGYDRGGRDACLGDSGGPLMCQKPDGKWEVMGVTSNGYGCARPHRPGVYTKVVKYLPWMEQILELGHDERVIPLEVKCDGHRCPLGQCIPPEGVCNGKVECSDGSDEKDCV